MFKFKIIIDLYKCSLTKLIIHYNIIMFLRICLLFNIKIIKYLLIRQILTPLDDSN